MTFCTPNLKVTWLRPGWNQCESCGTEWHPDTGQPNCFVKKELIDSGIPETEDKREIKKIKKPVISPIELIIKRYGKP